MKITISRQHFIKAIATVSKAITSKSVLPVLTGLKVEVDQTQMTLTGSNTELTIVTHIPCTDQTQTLIEVHEPGIIILPAKYVLEIIKKVQDDTINLEKVDSGLIRLSTETSEFQLNDLAVEEYPVIQLITDQPDFHISSNVLKSIIRQTLFCASTSESRPILTGVHFILEGKELRVVATDSYRLAQKVVPLPKQVSFSKDIVIPAKTLTELMKVLEDEEKIVTIYFTDNKVLFMWDDIFLQSRLLEGTYPQTNRLIPTEFHTEVTIDHTALFQAIDRASLLAREATNNVVNLNITASKIEVTSNSPEVGQVRERLETKQLLGEPLRITFNARYALEALRALDANEVTISFVGELRPFIMRSKNDIKVTQLILPVHTY
ncbi:MAG: DNA polymerase III subunit beta [Culicoidibacterales bacterium]